MSEGILRTLRLCETVAWVTVTLRLCVMVTVSLRLCVRVT